MTERDPDEFYPDDELDRQYWEDEQPEPRDEDDWAHETQEPPDDYWNAPVVEEVQLPGLDA
jgi:hypothetical protein